MRTLIGVGTPRGLQRRVAAVLTLVVALWTRLIDFWRPFDTTLVDSHVRMSDAGLASNSSPSARQKGPFNHGLLGDYIPK